MTAGQSGLQSHQFMASLAAREPAFPTPFELTAKVNTSAARYGTQMNFTVNWNSRQARSLTIKIIDRELGLASNDPLLEDLSLAEITRQVILRACRFAVSRRVDRV